MLILVTQKMHLTFHLIKKRVTAAQFASIKAIANTPRSPRFTNSLHQNDSNVNNSGEKTSENSSLEDTERLSLEDADYLNSVERGDMETASLRCR